MNEKILEIFSRYQVKPLKGELPGETLRDLAIQIQGERTHSLVFYRITESSDAAQKFLERAKNTNAAVLVINKSELIPPEYRGALYYCPEQSWIELQKDLSEVFYPVSNKVKLLGITGTNGKTTSVNLTRDLLWSKGVRACSVGTIGLQGRDGHVIEDLSITTPSYLDIRRILSRYGEEFDVFVFEVSSHALDQERFFGMNFTAAAWTNLTQDHLDYHKDFVSYGKAKAKLANISKKLFVLANHDEVTGVLNELGAPYEKLEIEKVPSECPAFFKLAHNWENLILAKALACETLGRDLQVDWKSLHPPRGRFETLEWMDRLIVIDYAHTPDALAKILASTKESFPGRRLICVFGAGGDRDPTKRPVMGKLASEHADLVVVTSDNPRSEEPQSIVDQVLKGVSLKDKLLFSDPDRRRAIERTLECSHAQDIIVIAGKGHETYQEVKGVKHPFDDKQVALDYVDRQRNEE